MPRAPTPTQKPKIDLSNVSKPGDVLKAILQKKEQEAAVQQPRAARHARHASDSTALPRRLRNQRQSLRRLSHARQRPPQQPSVVGARSRSRAPRQNRSAAASGRRRLWRLRREHPGHPPPSHRRVLSVGKPPVGVPPLLTVTERPPGRRCRADLARSR